MGKLGEGQLLKRTLTAVVGVPLLLGVYYAGGWALFGLLTLLIIVSAGELWRMFFHLSSSPSRADLIIGGLSLLLAAYISTKYQYAVSGAVVTALFFFFAVKELVTRSKLGTERVALALLGSVYVGLYSYLWLLREMEPNGRRFLFMVVLIIWAQDIGAYFIGIALGKHSLAPSISPKKTIEGALGGLACGVVVGGLLGLVWGMASKGLLLGVAAGIAGQIGDLVESALKRGAGLKDSGSILPGHGGLLDRFDSLMFAAPIAYLLLTVLSG
ncbi:MAG: phosphatidate cytidylyltransferase [Limnochordia bacterium]|jgi:phosphatidate cytidylyltransferase|nr:phosphatidate cytidylyltransferase [Limnochordia bacterium]MDD2628946.1 phosphatidate cytidylyltransferase [Limnochordia bacterium]MDD2756125.1 phosphatidate cytidylyltransferase [Methanothrix sp.]MDD4516922.1 phosphatidate cytidylyltransferase [Limnochordia bacterium]